MHILKSIYLVMSLVTAMTFTSCGDDDDNGNGVATFEVPKELLTDGLSVPATGGENSFTVKSSERVTARVDADDTSWISASVGNSTTDGFNVTVKTQPNDTEKERTAKLILFAGNTPKTINVKQATSYVAPQPPQGDDDDTPIKDVTAKQLLSRMVAGVNIGNTLEVPGGETGWGNPEVNEAYIKGLKALGFNAVRVPCAWDSHVSDAATNTIDPAWLERVDQVVGWIVDNDMYAIVNIHWDGGWLEENVANPFNQTIDRKQHDYWTQIATRLNHFDEHLLFAGMNEPGQQNGTGGDAIANIIRYQQTFIDAVRATGGNNALRCLVVQAPNTNIDLSEKDNYRKNMPKDNVADKLVMEVHFYDPSDFTIMDKDGAWADKVKYFWGEPNLVPGSDRNATWGDEAFVASQMVKMKKNYVDAGIPVIIGEYSSSVRNAGEYQAQHEASRAYWNEVVTREARNNGCVPFYWETGMDINRKDGTAKCQYAIDGIMAGVKASTLPF